MFSKLAALSLFGLAASVCAVPYSEFEGVEVDYDALVDAEASGSSSGSPIWNFIKRATGIDANGVVHNLIPRKMFPFVVSINVDLPKSQAEAIYNGLTTPPTAQEMTNLFANYDDYSKPYCAGAVIHQNWILTAGRCMEAILQNNWTDHVTIYANRKHMRPVKNENWINFTIVNGASDIFLHPFYNPVSFENDLALIRVVPYTPRGKLIKKLHAKRYKFPIIMDESDNITVNAVLTSGGWGLVDKEVRDPNKFTKYGDVFFLTRIAPSYREISLANLFENECDRGNVYINSSIACAGVVSAKNGALCVYDEGAPIFLKGEWRSGRSSWNSKLVSIFSQYIDSTDGPGALYTCQPEGNYRAVSTKVAAHCAWLRQVTNSAINCFGIVS